MTTMTHTITKAGIEEIIGSVDDYGVDFVEVGKYNYTLRISNKAVVQIRFAPNKVVTFSKLQQLSDYVGTDRIDLIPYDPGSPDYSSYTPGDPASPNYIVIYLEEERKSCVALDE